MRLKYLKEKQDLKAQHTQLMAAFAELDPDPVFRFDDEGRIIMANEAGVKLFPNNYAVGKSLHEIIPNIKNIDLENLIKNSKHSILITPVGEEYYKFILRGIPDLNIGQIYGSNISDLKQTEEQLIYALNQAEESEKLKSYFLAQISHEIRSPLTAVLGFNTIIREEVKEHLTEELDYAFLAIENSGKRLKRTIDQLLNMSQLHLGKIETKKEKIDLNKLLKGLVDEYQSEVKAKKLDLLYEQKIKETELIGDNYAINQIFLNLVDNAIKYTEKGVIKIIVNRNEERNIIVSVADSGIGMSQNYVDKLFTPFTQEVMGYNRPFEGTGIGLAICNKYAELNDAEIKVSSVKNHGSIFTVIFKN